MVFMQKAAVNVMLSPPQADEEWTMIWLCSFKRTQSRVFEIASSNLLIFFFVNLIALNVLMKLTPLIQLR